MINIVTENMYAFRTDSEKKITGSEPFADDASKNMEADGGDFLLCRQCLHVVTSRSEKRMINGSHNHSFANPHGIFFEIGCFGNARGCGHSSESSGEFTWFRGFRWQVAVCRGCLNHLGWLFTSSANRFYGLILDQLIVSDRSEKH